MIPNKPDVKKNTNKLLISKCIGLVSNIKQLGVRIKGKNNMARLTIQARHLLDVLN